MKRKQLLKLRGTIMALLVVLSVMNLQATVFPYVTKLQSFGGSSANTSTFTPIPGDYTLEVQGTVGTAISVAGGVYTYTPSTSGTVRFVQKSGVVYVYEGTTYMTSITPSYSSIFPTIADANVTTDANNLLTNASFETVGTVLSSTPPDIRYKFGTPWVTNVTETSGGIRCGYSASAVNGTIVCVWRGTANSNYFAQPISSTIKSNTFYKVVLRQIAGANSTALFNIGLGSTVSGMEYGSKTMLLANGKNSQYSLVLGTPASVTGTTYFTFKNSAVNTATPGTQTDPMTQLDYIELIEGTFGTPGIAGVSSATFLEGSAYAPDVTVNYSGGDSYDMTTYVLNRGFDNLRGEWTETPTANIGTYVYSEVEFYSKTFNLSQVITGLPAGIYQLKAQGFERAAANNTTNIAVYPNEVIYSKLYASTSVSSGYNKTFNSLYLNTFQTGWGGTALNNYVNSTVSASGAFAAGYYDMSLDNIIVGDNGALTIGASKATNVTNSWTIMDNFRLYYFGPVVDPLLSAPQTSVSLTTTTNTAAIDLTGSNLTADITITVPSTHITLSGTNVTGTSPNYTIALANANQLNTITATWDKAANVSDNISFTSTTASKTIAVTTSDVETVALSGISLSAGGLNALFAVGTTSYTAKAPADASSTTVTATFTPSVANVTNNSTTISASTPSVVLTGNSYNNSAHTAGYTVNWGGNYTFTDWAANGDITSTSMSLPSTYGWKCMNTTIPPSVEELVWNNYGTQSNCRYTNPASYTYGGAPWTGRVLLIRWDGGGFTNRVFSYPVYLEAGTYQINGKAAYHGNSTAPTLSFKVNAANDNSGTNYATSSVVTGASGALMDIKLINITITTPGVYYFTVSSTTASMCTIADLTLNTQISQTFTGSVDYTWSNASNWSTRVPLAGDDVIVSSGTLTVDQNALAKSITVAPGASITLNSGSTLSAGIITLQGDATNGSATFKDLSGSANVTATVQQVLSGTSSTIPRGWWYVSSPVNNANAAVFIPDLSTNKFGYWNEPTFNYPQINIADNTTTYLALGKGYVFNNIGTDVTINFTGTLNTGDVTISPTRTGTSDGARGFNLVGNPYPSYLDWNAVTKTNVRSTIWYRTWASGGGGMIFDTYDGSVGTGNGINGTVSSLIPPMQGFWVKVDADPVLPATTSTGTITYHNNDRSHKSTTTNLLRSKASGLTLSGIVRLRVSNGLNSDETILVGDVNALDVIDIYDSPKMKNNNTQIPEIYTLVGTEELVINHLNSISADKELTLGFRPGKVGEFSFVANELSNIDPDVNVILKDKKLQIEYNLTAGSVYTFNSDESETVSRFSIIFKSASVTTNQQILNSNNVFVSSNYNNQLLIQINGEISSNCDVSVYNSIGQKLISERLTQNIHVFDNMLVPGVYIVSLNNGGQTMIKKVIVK